MIFAQHIMRLEHPDLAAMIWSFGSAAGFIAFVAVFFTGGRK